MFIFPVRKLCSVVPSPVLAIFVYAIASGYSMSALPLLIPNGALSVSLLSSWLTSALYAGLLIGTFTSNPLIARLGHKGGFIFFQLCFAATLVLLPLWMNQIFWLLDRFIGGWLIGGSFVSIESWLLKGSSEGRRKRLSVYMGMLYAGIALGQLTLSWFGAYGLVPFVLSAGLSVVAAISLALLPTYQAEESPAQVEFTPSGKHRVKLPAMMGCLISGILLGAVYGLMPVQLVELGKSQIEIGNLMAILILGAMAVQPVISLLSKRISRTLLMCIFALLGSASIGILGQMFHQLAACMFVLGMALFAFYPIAINLGSSSIPEQHMVSASQQMLFIYSIGSIFGPMVAHYFMASANGLFSFLFITLTATAIYMLLISVKSNYQLLVHK